MMKSFKIALLFLVLLLVLPTVSTHLVLPVKAESENPLKIEKIIGLSKEPGTFRNGHGLAVAKDGTISTVPSGKLPTRVEVVGRIKLVNPAEAKMVRGDDGLFRTRDGKPVDADIEVRVAPGNLESSNVNTVEVMVNMISLARQFDMQMKMLQSADNNAKQASQLLNMNA